MTLRSLVATVFFVSSSAFAQVIPPPEILTGATLVAETLENSLASVRPGTIVVLGEEHGTPVHQAFQLMVMKELRRQGLSVSVGMEFLDFTTQKPVDQFRDGSLSEADFLRVVNWSGSFDFYRAQILFPTPPQRTVALNVPRNVSGKIAKQGLSGLSVEDLELLPKNFLTSGRGNNSYFERFKQVMAGHMTDPTKLENYFLAQSAWDDTMAYRATEHMNANPNDVLVIVVGDFHVSYGGGLPDRLKKWGARDVVTVSMINTAGLTDVEKQVAITPANPDGPRADWIWLAEF